MLTAMAVAHGQFVRFLDSDDWLTPQANYDQLELARQTGAGVVVAGYEHHDDSGAGSAQPA